MTINPAHVVIRQGTATSQKIAYAKYTSQTFQYNILVEL